MPDIVLESAIGPVTPTGTAPSNAIVFADRPAKTAARVTRLRFIMQRDRDMTISAANPSKGTVPVGGDATAKVD